MRGSDAKRSLSAKQWSKVVVLLLLGPGLIAGEAKRADADPLQPAGTITVSDTVLGQTTTYIGATEAGVFFIDDLTDLGINTYRLWTKMDELEWWDDDDADQGYNCNKIGSPTIAQIKADQASGFVNTIPWAWWDEQFTGTYYTWSGNSREDVISQCTSNGITPVLVLRNIDDAGGPSNCGGAWAPDSPITQSDLNEWWEHAFAIAYWLNVKHSYAVTHFEVLNEPDLSSQGWHGTRAEYVQLVATAYDAVKFANDIAGIDTVLHVPVVANYGSTYIAYSLTNADDEIDVVDYHNYDNDPTTSISAVKSTIANNNPDNTIEPIWLSEWGTYTSTYDTLSRAVLTAQQLLTFSAEAVEGVTIFGMYDWGSPPSSGFYGLLSTTRQKTETYYAYRLMTRGLRGGKDRLDFTASGVGGDTMVTAAGNKLYIVVVNGGASIQADISALGVTAGSVSVYEYSSTNKDVIVATPTMTNGQFTFTAPGSGIALAEVTSQQLVVELASFEAQAYEDHVLVTWETLSEVDTAGFNLYRSKASGGPYSRLNPVLIPARGDILRGARYTYEDFTARGPATYFYELEDVDTLGRSTRQGRVRTGAGPDTDRGWRIYLPRVVRRG